MEQLAMIATRVSALALVAMLGVSAAYAQTPPGSGSPPPDRMQGRAEWPQRREMREAAHAKALHDALNIRPDQETAFQAFTASMRPPERGPGADQKRGDRQAMAGMTTPERLDAMGRMMDERMQRMRERFQQHATTVKGFYAALSPEQRRTFDALPYLMGGGMGMGGHGMGLGDRPGMREPAMGMSPPGAGQ
jgi:hypothetical protein